MNIEKLGEDMEFARSAMETLREELIGREEQLREFIVRVVEVERELSEANMKEYRRLQYWVKKSRESVEYAEREYNHIAAQYSEFNV